MSILTSTNTGLRAPITETMIESMGWKKYPYGDFWMYEGTLGVGRIIKEIENGKVQYKTTAFGGVIYIYCTQDVIKLKEYILILKNGIIEEHKRGVYEELKKYFLNNILYI